MDPPSSSHFHHTCAEFRVKEVCGILELQPGHKCCDGELVAVPDPHERAPTSTSKVFENVHSVLWMGR
jgi:hypothetical protein